MLVALASLVVASTVPTAQPLVPPGTPVHVWLEPGGSLAPGEQAHVFVNASGDGNLIVLLARVDGSVTMLFPRSPADDPFVHAGTYEIVGSGDRPALTADDIGRGVILAAVSPDPVWFDEFTAGRGWSNAALTGAGAGRDPEGVLSDVVQRMLGDGSFNYDVATYYVTPPPAVAYDAQPPVFDDCLGCDYVAPTVGYVDVGYGVLATPLNYNCRYLHVCSPFLFPARFPVRRDIRDIPTVVSVPFPPQHAIAVYTHGQPTGVVAPSPVVARPRTQPVAPRYSVVPRPRARTVTAPASVAAVPRASSPQLLAPRTRPSAEVVSVAVARQRVLQRRPRPVPVQGPEAAAGAVPAGFAIAAPRERMGASLALTTAPAIAPVMMRPQLAGAPVNVRTRTTAGMPAMPGTPMVVGAQGVGMGMAQTIAMPHMPPRLRMAR